MPSTDATDDFAIVTRADVSTFEDDEYEIVDVATTTAAPSAEEQVSVDGELKDVVVRRHNGVSIKGVFLEGHFTSLEVSQTAVPRFDAQY